ncbi:GAF domain-containing sensor histidine kinase [Dactylosporangium sucinum]|uniref:histidine kinase n=1 Tax=Dactylosporangium sucinum TaxID=1424081 RepID=A0A917UGL5_9ACTN|nr:GAF domain-containing protein [Dactylosporangium sucinum]GGM89155.1 hypothetical protein GCM10007977_108950 [Dactylosporangium sucinum]
MTKTLEVSRGELRRLLEEQSALRRIATLVAQTVSPAKVFEAVTAEVGQLCGADLARMERYETDGSVTGVGIWSREDGSQLAISTRFVLEGTSIAAIVQHACGAARIDSFAHATGPIAEEARRLGIRSSVGCPIIVAGRLWGVIAASTKGEAPFPANTESQIADFTELVATAIANAESRDELTRLLDQQSALRRVATLVAHAVPPTEVFSAVAAEVARLIGADGARLVRYEADGTATVVAAWGVLDVMIPVGSRVSLEGGNLSVLVLRSGRAARMETYADAPGPVAAELRDHGVRSAVGAPIYVEGRLWGALVGLSTNEEPLQQDAEARLTDYTDLVATAIASADARANLVASRARVVVAADQARRRIERDLHDGIQQQLVSLGLDVRNAEASLPPETAAGPRAQLSAIADELTTALDDMREISRGIHPAILSEGGLRPAFKALARRSPVAVDLDVHLPSRLPEPIEVAAYYVVAEALANAAKHAHASHVRVEAAMRNGSLHLSARDDGIGGADPARGSGLIGLADRIEALGGTITVDSPAGHGTSMQVELPIGK